MEAAVDRPQERGRGERGCREEEPPVGLDPRTPVMAKRATTPAFAPPRRTNSSLVSVKPTSAHTGPRARCCRTFSRPPWNLASPGEVYLRSTSSTPWRSRISCRPGSP